MNRRGFLRSSVVAGAALSWQALLPAWAQSGALNTQAGVPALQGNEFDLTVAASRALVAGKRARHITVNGQFPAPLLRWREGDELTLRIHNTLDEPTSIHWHGILLPWQMDGVPGVSFPGIAAGDTFTYRFPLKQAGTYWYHSHSGLQEQLGHYGPLIIDPREPEPFAYDREYVVLLSDWSAEKPERVYSKLKKMSSAYNYQQRTVGDFFRDVRASGLDATLAERMMWGEMRMNPTDLADVTAATYTYLVNGHSPAENWTALFQRGERIRLRFINASAMSIFNIRVPGLPMTVVQADGLNVQPVETDEFQIGTAETFDVIVQPQADQAYAIYAESNDRYGYAAATLAPRAGMQAEVPSLRSRPLLTMKDMGMDHGEHAVSAPAAAAPASMAGMDHSAHTAAATEAPVVDHSAHTAAVASALVPAGTVHAHALGPGVASLATNPVTRLHERPLGLENEVHRVLVYNELRSLVPNPDQRTPERELQLHLTANMERYMWSFDGLKFSEVDGPLTLRLGERVRLTFVNDTMMPHPVHLHGMFFDVVTDESANKPRKHTLLLKPGEKASVDVTADAPGDWAFHCHLLYHMHAGMMRVFTVSGGGGSMNKPLLLLLLVASPVFAAEHDHSAATSPPAEIAVDHSTHTAPVTDTLERDNSAAMQEARHMNLMMHGDALNFLVLGERFEQAEDEGTTSRQWEAQGWIGYDRDKLWLKTEGRYDVDAGDIEHSEVQALYSRAIAPYWDLQAGLRRDDAGSASRTHVVLGVMGLAPYWFEVDAAAFVSEHGDVSARLEAEYELRFTQKLLLQPRVELNYSFADDFALGIGDGVSEAVFGLRLRYELRREFAPYLGVEWSRAYGNTAALLGAAGRKREELNVVAGLRFWY